MTRPRTPSTFRQRDVTRAVKGVVKGGVPVSAIRAVRINPQGAIEIDTGEQRVQDFQTPLDQWMAEHARKA
jgi:hypothetical protein